MDGFSAAYTIYAHETDVSKIYFDFMNFLLDILLSK